ncbi:hypothetical protein ACHAWF_002518 [Thalassiosira exigua]
MKKRFSLRLLPSGIIPLFASQPMLLSFITNMVPRAMLRNELPDSTRSVHRVAASGNSKLNLFADAEPFEKLPNYQGRAKEAGSMESAKNSLALGANLKPSQFNGYTPPEWDALSADAKVKMAHILSWDNISKWDFNIVEVADLTCDATKVQCCPLLLIGWVLLCGPMAQEAMAHYVRAQGGNSEEEDSTLAVDGKAYLYNFEDLNINPLVVCNFLREVERRYHPNPYHNNIHAADITQTTHAIFQMMGERHLRRMDPIMIFSIILAAVFHDVDHPGTNNMFHQNAMTDLAIKYDNVSILENMHSDVGYELLLGEERRDEWDVFKTWTPEQKARARNMMTTAILKGTDMSNHFALLKEMTSLIEQVRSLAEEASLDLPDADIGKDGHRPILSVLARCLDENNEPPADGDGECSLELSKLKESCKQLDDMINGFILHAADISGSAKSERLVVYWADSVLEEFFAQGDKEKEMNLPISPLCDRETVTRHDSQIGFVTHMVRPTFELLAKLIPRVKEDVLPSVANTLEYWTKEKQLVEGGQQSES